MCRCSAIVKTEADEGARTLDLLRGKRVEPQGESDENEHVHGEDEGSERSIS
jgi:hypothetical protein